MHNHIIECMRKAYEQGYAAALESEEVVAEGWALGDHLENQAGLRWFLVYTTKPENRPSQRVRILAAKEGEG